MCDAVSLSIASTLVGAAGTAASSMGAASAAKKQANEVKIWQQQQQKNRQEEGARQEGMRAEAEAARVKGLQDISVEDQARRQKAEEERLTPFLAGETATADAGVESGGVPISVADTAMLSGQQSGGENFVESIGKKINDAGASARKRIASMAGLSSYGGSGGVAGEGGGLGVMNPILQGNTATAIDTQNEFRRGSLVPFGLKQQIGPVEIQSQPSPLADIFSLALGAGAQGMGNAFGNPLIAGEKTTEIIPTPRPATRRIGGAGSAPGNFNIL